MPVARPTEEQTSVTLEVDEEQLREDKKARLENLFYQKLTDKFELSAMAKLQATITKFKPRLMTEESIKILRLNRRSVELGTILQSKFKNMLKKAA